MAYNTGFGSANEVLGGSRFVELTTVPCGRPFHEVDTMPLRMPDLLHNPVTPSYALRAPQIDLSGLFPKPAPVRISRQPKIWDPDPVYVPEGRLERLADLELLRFSDDD